MIGAPHPRDVWLAYRAIGAGRANAWRRPSSTDEQTADKPQDMAALLLEVVALATVALSFAFSLMVFVFSRQPDGRERTSAPSDAIGDDQGSVTETMARVLAQVAQLAALREQGALTDKEFAAQKARLLQVDRDRPQPSRRAH